MPASIFAHISHRCRMLLRGTAFPLIVLLFSIQGEAALAAGVVQLGRMPVTVTSDHVTQRVGAKTAFCALTVDGAEIIKGPCRFEPLSRDGSFEIITFDNRFFAYVEIDSPGVAEGYWNETPFAYHAHTPLGTLRRQDACWINDYASVCAY